jgi:Uma2 family endonuclease
MVFCYNTTMTLARIPSPTAHAILHDVAWEDYERILAEIGNGPTRVNYLDGSMEIMSPLPEHEDEKKVMARLVEALTFELEMPCRGFGSATFRRQEGRAGLEPDECFYIQNEEKVRGMKRFNPRKHPPPDLAFEIDMTSSSLPRESIYARLGVPEIWRRSRNQTSVRLLSEDGSYLVSASSAVFPFFPMPEMDKFINRMLCEEPNGVLRDFLKWVRRNRRKWAGR